MECAGFESRELSHASGEPAISGAKFARRRLSPLVRADPAALWRLRISHRARGKIRIVPGMRGPQPAAIRAAV